MNEEIVIDIDNLRARKILNDNKNHFYIEQYADKIKDLIDSRIGEFESSSQNLNLDYFEYKMHDSILIYGTRGNGKTTIMMNLEEILHGVHSIKDIKIMEIIDPTLLEENEDFLLVILKNLYRHVLQNNQNSFDSYLDNDKNRFETQLEKILEQIEGTRASIDKIEIFEKFYGNKSGVSLAIAIHDLFHTLTKIFKVKAIILPIDDIDMNMTQGYNITETIRKYLSSPYVIPIVSFNLKQMNAIAKKKKYEAFGLDIKQANKGDYKDLEFLLSLASDYLASIFPPNRRVFLKSILPILKEELREKKESNHNNLRNKKIYLKSEKLNIFKNIHNVNIDKNLTIFSDKKIDITILLRLFLETVYEKTLKHDFLFDNTNNISDYLTNRSVRDFFNDMSAIIRSLRVNKESGIIKSKQSLLLTRFSPENQSLFINKKQALTSLWDDFLEIAKKNITNNAQHQDIKNNWAELITSITHEDYPELVNKKTYRRLWLQRYYNNIPLTMSLEQEDKNKKELFHFKIKKKTSISGFLELAIRSYIPMFLFESIISHHRVDYSMYDVMKLRNFAKDSLIDVVYHISTMELLLKKHTYKEENLRIKAKLFASIHINYRKDEIYKAEYNIPFLFKLRNQDLFFYENREDSNQIYFFSIFKSIALFIESLQILEKHHIDVSNFKKINIQNIQKNTESEFKRLFEKYAVNLPCEHEDKFVENFILEIFKNNYIDKLLNIENFTLENSELGIIECMRFSKRVIRFFYEIRSNIKLNDNFSSLNFNINRWVYNDGNCSIYKEEKKSQNFFSGEGTLSEYFDFPLSSYLIGFSQSLLISLINTQQNYQEFIIYTKNSIHGANLLLLNKNKKGEFHLSKSSNIFLSNINYLLPQKTNKNTYPVLKSIADKSYTCRHQYRSNNKTQILNFYENFLGIKYFLPLMENYEDIPPTEDCKFKDNGKNHAS